MKREFLLAVQALGLVLISPAAGIAHAAEGADLEQRLVATQEAELKQHLNDFYKDSYRTMDQIPVKRDEQGNPVSGDESLFPADSVESRDFVQAKDETRARLTQTEGKTFKQMRIESAPGDNDRAENLIESPNLLRTLKEMETASLLTKELSRKPWSDSYWALAKGLAAARYADPGFPASLNPGRNMEYIFSNPASSMIANGNGNNLSPAEKYDYLMGDDGYTFTNRAWEVVRASGAIAGWAGICDGWSAGAVTFDEPVSTVVVTGSGGRQMKFYPHDVKGLSAMLWAKGNFPTRFIGSRCAISKPQRDEVGRVQAPECSDNNAGTWHLSVVNQLGVADRALIIDATYDHQIWNFPVWKYRYSYFNPQTLQPSKNWRAAVVPVDRFTIDKFKKYRSPDAKYVAGISMSITYSIENKASHAQGSRISTRSVHYIYDVELDADMKIVGGEWYTNIHPDFTWFPRAGSIAVSVGDNDIEDRNAWTGSDLMPETWTRAARVASQRLQPLAAVVEKLVQLSSGGTGGE